MSTSASPTSTSRNAGPRVVGVSLGPFETNCYIVTPGGSGIVAQDTTGEPDSRCWIVDPGMDPEEVVEHLKAKGLHPEAIVLTHAHVDHIAGVADVLRAFPRVPIWIHEAERAWLNDPLLNLSGLAGASITAPGPDRLLKDGEVLTLAGEPWRVLHTPGHSPGGITLVHDASKQAIVGDTLFAGSIGRSDFPGSDGELLARSIRTKLYTLSDDTVIYPGHGGTSTIGREKRTNPFVRAEIVSARG